MRFRSCMTDPGSSRMRMVVREREKQWVLLLFFCWKYFPQVHKMPYIKHMDDQLCPEMERAQRYE